METAKIIPFDPIHAYELLDKKIREEDMWVSGQDWELAINGWFRYGPGYTVKIGDDILCVCGVVLMGNGNGEAWSLMSPMISKYPVTLSKCMIRCLNDSIQVENLKRVQAIVNPDHEKAKRFMEFLGFSLEGTLKGFGVNKEDLLMYGRVI